MRFHVGPHLYRVEVSPNPLFDDESRPLLGACDADRRRILICPTCPLQARLNVVLHELRHANIYATGMAPQDPESDADHYAASTENIIMDLERQGGLPALLAMGMDDAGRYDLTAARHTLAEVGNGMPLVSCSTCMQRIAHGSVVVTETSSGVNGTSLYTAVVPVNATFPPGTAALRTCCSASLSSS